MKPIIERPRFDGRHPIERRDSIFLTPAIETMGDKVKEWMNNGIPGGLVFGHQRFGKTRAARALVQRWNSIIKGDMPAWLIDVRKRAVASEDGFFEDLLVGMHHEFPSKGKAKDKRNRARDFALCEAERANSDAILLAIDNAQRLDNIHYEWLCNFFDELDYENVLAFTVSIGEPDLRSIRSGFEASGQMQSVGRFMVEEHWFRGILEQKELERVFGWFDTKQFPEGSEWSFSRYYYPEAFDAGWRLLQEAPLVWSLWSAWHADLALPTKIEIPMQYLASVIRRFMLLGKQHDAAEFRGGNKLWRPLIASSGYAKAARYVRVITGESSEPKPEQAPK